MPYLDSHGRLVRLLQPPDAFLPAVSVLLRSVRCISHQKSASVTLVVFVHLTVYLLLFQYPLLYHIGLVLYLGSDDIFISVLLHVEDVLFVHQTGIGDDDKIIKFVFADELLNYRHHGMPLILVALMYAICQRVAVETHQQSQNDLRVLVTSFFGESRLAHVILPVSLKVKRRHVIEHHSDIAAEQLPGVMHAYVLNLLLLCMVELVEIAVYLGKIHILVEMVLEILHGGSLARRT